MNPIDAVPELTLPKGVKDFLPIKAAKIEFLNRTLRSVFSQWGFRPITPPGLEFLHVLERGLGEGLREKTFRFDDRQSGRLVAFPPDITPQVARIVATRMREFPLPLRLYYSGRVLRHTEQQAGKDREIFQAGVEMIGLDSPEADAEMIAMAVETLKALGAAEFTIDIGQVEFFRGVMEGCPLPPALSREVQGAIARKDSSGLRALVEQAPLSDQAREELLALPRLFGGQEVLERAAKVVSNERSQRALENLSQVLEVLKVYGVEEHVTFDLGELRGLDYHTGLTFQGFLTGMGRAVCSGGRYDNLTARYGFPAPATGFTFNLLNLLFALDRELDTAGVVNTDVLIFQPGADKQRAQRAARALRQQGFSAARDIIRRDLGATLDYAHKMNFRYVMVIEEDQEKVRLIHLADGNETGVSYSALLAGNFAL
ncbi:ATP phosphoribosyltransferase regulatory subunit [Desulfuromonas versatilis]|uniref:ATP phosphoribosyltransferase regulatory subunit n=1 Tax=Desulfuromonas versatilis TaxID=2802975 RepID=A0ABM8HP65_9BACT|nr:ATP phosphoribosyltransferase regulatory subunit [Desulfuromonas versatilis]BCR03391.1 ATP phosphoribosyltransferase regulatory subunit [Desulfuromonas versatilis]